MTSKFKESDDVLVVVRCTDYDTEYVRVQMDKIMDSKHVPIKTCLYVFRI